MKRRARLQPQGVAEENPAFPSASSSLAPVGTLDAPQFARTRSRSALLTIPSQFASPERWSPTVTVWPQFARIISRSSLATTPSPLRFPGIVTETSIS